ncbi:urease accessory protein UreD [Echinicola sp. 20G]|uniref:urease accessory protein UreD n=1 Tax=Echinicola sp. 20G TaxID=2781961 RepID=UPI0019107F56|nr:urease accessory protein UreD [Echinicola sp. 20G]
MEKYYLKTGLRQQTILKDVFFTPPFNLVEVRENKKDPLLEVMIMSSSPGMLNDDHYDINIEVIDHSALNLQTQAYQRIYVSKKGTTQKMNVKVGKEAYFSYVPHPTVPHKGANYKTENTIHLNSSSTLVWGEILTCGRKFMDQKEEFTFTKHHAITQVYVDDRLIFKDNLYLMPEKINVQDMGQYEGFTHQGCLLYIAPNADINLKKSKFGHILEEAKEIEFGISVLNKSALVIRLLGNSGELLYQILSKIRIGEDEIINESIKELWEQN